MANWFRKKTASMPDGVTASDAMWGPARFRIVYEQKPQPSPGAQAYAYESLSLPPFPPSGPSITVRGNGQPRPVATPMYTFQAIPLTGLGGTVAGSLYGGQLFDPNGPGFSGPPPYALSPLTAMNRATINPDFQATLRPNVVDPTRTRPGM